MLRVFLLLLLLVAGVWCCWALGLAGSHDSSPRDDSFAFNWPPTHSIESIEVGEDSCVLLFAGDDQRHLIQPSPGTRLRISAWDRDAIVYVTVGEDDAPGVAGVDDEGNGIVDDLSEIGATGSDDVMLTPVDAGYDDAASGKTVSIILSRGAMIPVPPNQVIKGPTEVRIDLTDDQNRLTSKIFEVF